MTKTQKLHDLFSKKVLAHQLLDDLLKEVPKQSSADFRIGRKTQMYQIFGAILPINEYGFFQRRKDLRKRDGVTAEFHITDAKREEELEMMLTGVILANISGDEQSKEYEGLRANVRGYLNGEIELNNLKKSLPQNLDFAAKRGDENYETIKALISSDFEQLKDKDEALNQKKDPRAYITDTALDHVFKRFEDEDCGNIKEDQKIGNQDPVELKIQSFVSEVMSENQEYWKTLFDLKLSNDSRQEFCNKVLQKIVAEYKAQNSQFKDSSDEICLANFVTQNFSEKIEQEVQKEVGSQKHRKTKSRSPVISFETQEGTSETKVSKVSSEKKIEKKKYQTTKPAKDKEKLEKNRQTNAPNNKENPGLGLKNLLLPKDFVAVFEKNDINEKKFNDLLNKVFDNIKSCLELNNKGSDKKELDKNKYCQFRDILSCRPKSGEFIDLIASDNKNYDLFFSDKHQVLAQHALDFIKNKLEIKEDGKLPDLLSSKESLVANMTNGSEPKGDILAIAAVVHKIDSERKDLSKIDSINNNLVVLKTVVDQINEQNDFGKALKSNLNDRREGLDNNIEKEKKKLLSDKKIAEQEQLEQKRNAIKQQEKKQQKKNQKKNQQQKKQQKEQNPEEKKKKENAIFLLDICATNHSLNKCDETKSIECLDAQVRHNPGVYKDLQAKSSFTALHLLSYYGFNGAIEALLDVGSDINAKSRILDITPIFMAIEGGQYETCKLLLGRGCKLSNEKDNVLHRIIYFSEDKNINDWKIVQYMKSFLPKCYIDDKNIDDEEIDEYLELFFSKCDKKLFEFFNENDQNLLSLAVINGKRKEVVGCIVDKMLALGININDIKDKEGRTVLHHAATIGNRDIINLLISKGADINVKDSKVSPTTPIGLVVDERTKELMKEWHEEYNEKPPSSVVESPFADLNRYQIAKPGCTIL